MDLCAITYLEFAVVKFWVAALDVWDLVVVISNLFLIERHNRLINNTSSFAFYHLKVDLLQVQNILLLLRLPKSHFAFIFRFLFWPQLDFMVFQLGGDEYYYTEGSSYCWPEEQVAFWFGVFA